MTLLRHAGDSGFLSARQWMRLISTLMSMDSQVPDVDGLSGALGQIALATYTTMFLRSLGPEKTFSDQADSALAE